MNKFAEAVNDLQSIGIGRRSPREEFDCDEPAPYSMGQASYGKWKAVKSTSILKDVDVLRGTVNAMGKALKLHKPDVIFFTHHGVTCLEVKAFEHPVRRLPSPKSLVILSASSSPKEFSSYRAAVNRSRGRLSYGPLDEFSIVESAAVAAYMPTAVSLEFQGVLPKARGNETKAQDFHPSRAVTRFLAEQEGHDLEAVHASLSKAVKDAVFGMMQSIADAHTYERESGAIQLSAANRFVESIAKALLARIDINTYDAPEFLTQLHRELLEAAPVSGNEWAIAKLNGGLALLVETSTPAAPAYRERAKVIRLNGGYRASKVE